MGPQCCGVSIVRALTLLCRIREPYGYSLNFLANLKIFVPLYTLYTCRQVRSTWQRSVPVVRNRLRLGPILIHLLQSTGKVKVVSTTVHVCFQQPPLLFGGKASLTDTINYMCCMPRSHNRGAYSHTRGAYWICCRTFPPRSGAFRYGLDLPAS